tara:strand:- start:931 stop:1272 length:342 start_codon:yes stop_codon:yes gene_type:complete
MNQNNSEIRIKKYFPPPPLIGTYYEYIDVNQDKDLRKLVTDFFYKKVIKWVTNYPEFSHLKKHIKKLKSSEGYNLIYNLIKKFVKEYNLNWFDLRDNYPTFKDFLRFQIGNYI